MTTTEEYQQYSAGLPEVVVKSLWSASGRGVRFYRLPRDQAEALRHVERTLTADGALIVERKLQRVAELSFLYQYDTASSAGLRSLGASHFASAAMGAFGQERCGAGALDSVDALLPHGCRQRVQELLLTALNVVVTPRLGELPGCCFPLPLGVDAMVARTDAGLALRPTMELNLRRTMGLLSLGVERGLAPGVAATWTARHFEAPGQWAQYAQEQQRTNPLQLDGEGRIRQGFFRLTPAEPDQLFGGYGEAFLTTNH